MEEQIILVCGHEITIYGPSKILHPNQGPMYQCPKCSQLKGEKGWRRKKGRVPSRTGGNFIGTYTEEGGYIPTSE